MSLPQSNADLTLIEKPGISDDYDVEATSGSERWTGRIRVYLIARTERIANGLDSTVFVTRTLVLPASHASKVSQGDHLTIDPDIGTTMQVTARAIAVHQMPGVRGTIRIELEDQ